MTSEEKLIELLEKAYSEGYTEGHGDALASLGIKADDESDPVFIPPTANLENITVALFNGSEYPDEYAMGDGKTLVRKYIDSVVESDTIPSPTEQDNPLVIGYGGQTVLLTLNGKTREYEGGQPIHNLIPKEEYMCEVRSADGRLLEKGKMLTTGTVRMFGLDTQCAPLNIRDVGGYACNGGRMAYGKLIRSAFLPKSLTYDSASARMLREDIGVTLEIDLRGDGTREDLGWRGVTYSSTSYAAILTNTANLKKELEVIAKELEAGGCVLFHCLAGADRTGTLAAILQMICGVSENDVIHDWEMTSFCCWINIKAIDDEAKNKSEYPQGELRTFLRKLHNYGGSTYQERVINWLTGKAGVSKSTIQTLQDQLIVRV